MGIDGVDDIVFDGRDFSGGEQSIEHDHFCRMDGGAILASEDLHALGGGVGALIELAGQILDGEGGFVFRDGEVAENFIDLWFGEDACGGLVELRRI
jgi:hypothetical protein